MKKRKRSNEQERPRRVVVATFEMNGKRHEVDAEGSVRRRLSWEGCGFEFEGPVVGKMDLETQELVIDEIAYSGEFVGELLDAVPITQCSERSMKIKDNALQALGKSIRAVKDGSGISVIDGVMNAEEVAQARSAVLDMFDERKLSRVAHGQDYAIRNDKIAFVSTSFLRSRIGGKETVAGSSSSSSIPELEEGLEFEDSSSCGDGEEDDFGEGSAIQCPPNLQYAFRALAGAAQSACKLMGRKLLVPPQGMVAVYDGCDSKYVAHLDNDQVGSKWRNFRVLTLLMYLNEAIWDAGKDGGELKCHLQDGVVKAVAPTGGSCVLFDSRRILHEVAPVKSDKKRVAISLWLLHPDPSM